MEFFLLFRSDIQLIYDRGDLCSPDIEVIALLYDGVVIGVIIRVKESFLTSSAGLKILLLIAQKQDLSHAVGDRLFLL